MPLIINDPSEYRLMDTSHASDAILRDHEIDEERVQLERDFALMKEYLLMCFRKDDWHGVMDASADIREIVAKLSIMKWIEAPRRQ